MSVKSRAAAATRNKARRRNTLLITLAVVAIVVAMIYYEQVALLYVISTFAVAALLAVVAWADMGQARRVVAEAPLDDSAALGSGISTAAAQGRRPSRPRRSRTAQ